MATNTKKPSGKAPAKHLFQQVAEKGKLEGIDDTIVQRDTRTWFRNAAAEVKSVNRVRLLNDPANKVSQITQDDIGKMFMYSYDPKTKDDLPYYDTLPLIFPIGFAKDGFMGINLHYLPPILRAKLMDALHKTATDKKYNKATKLQVSYDILNGASRFKYFEPCVKRYLWEHVRSEFLNIEPRMWDYALMLPSERFMKSSKENVWNQSRKMF